jgi:2-keto-4-pentenoate hydratase/2-oxohepta-3-ene-1,7-dioic acid hydratase in catechol pathway
MKWLRCRPQGGPPGAEAFGVLDGDRVRMFAGNLFDAPQPTGETLPLDGVALLAPCRPGKIIGLWNNFRAAADKNGWATPEEPLYFLKSPGSLAVVIGRRARAVALADAAAHIFGYTLANDVTAIELLQRDPSFAQWTRAKSFDGFCPLGPVIETDFDPAVAQLRTLVGGRERQHYPLGDMFFSPAELVSRLSRDMTLEPGDVILCGTSLGVLPMKPGTSVEVVVDGIGTLVNRYG